MTRVHGRERNRRFRGWYELRILIDRRMEGDDGGECEFWAHRWAFGRSYVPMTDLSILCLHKSTTSWESQQRGGIVEDVMNGGEWVARLLWLVASV